MQVYWGTRVTKLSRVLLQQRQYQKNNPLPHPDDISKLNTYLEKSLKELDLSVMTTENFRKVAEVVSAKLLLYNRRRTGELQAIRLTDYNGRKDQNNILLGQLTAFEKKLLDTQEVLTVRGKTGRGVPIIIPETVKEAMAYLANEAVRQSAGVSSEYVFAASGHGVIRAYDALANACKKAELKEPRRITSTNLRKYMATVTQVLDLKQQEMEWVINHMGHTLDVHKIHYRATSDAIETTQIAKILLLQDYNKISLYRNKTLQDIQLEDLVRDEDESTEELTEQNASVDIESTIMNPDENEEFIPTELEDLMSVAEDIDETKKKRGKGGKENCKCKWTQEEEGEINKLFKKFLADKIRPTPKDCIQAIALSKKNGGIIYKRPKDVLKKKLFRMVDRLKKIT